MEGEMKDYNITSGKNKGLTTQRKALLQLKNTAALKLLGIDKINDLRH